MGFSRSVFGIAWNHPESCSSEARGRAPLLDACKRLRTPQGSGPPAGPVPLTKRSQVAHCGICHTVGISFAPVTPVRRCALEHFVKVRLICGNCGEPRDFCVRLDRQVPQPLRCTQVRRAVARVRPRSAALSAIALAFATLASSSAPSSLKRQAVGVGMCGKEPW